MENMGVITKVEQPPEWVSNIVVIDNLNKLRICIDRRPLNEAIKIPHYPIPSADRLMTNLQGNIVFSLFDATNGFWQLALDEESSYLTTFSTPWGRYRFLVLPCGLNNSPEEFQKENEPNVIPYFDDICIGSKTMEIHCQTLRMERDFELIKKKLLEAPCLQIFDSNKSVILSVDASTYGLGAVLL
ncbi:hypothetical protein AVEN_34411-1 [Araneus ventricosus]|uniref:Reverse transcriptase domain-containing protein n=1 Tax=Araneus ventricosus TaxID=182803 RepID=A0A4Y2G2Z8_ARAVE|nr:hypothetical protein AVEN_34411-1 [Araneus ventricosus]